MRDHRVKLGGQAARLAGGDVRPMRTIVVELRRTLGEDAKAPTYIFTEPRVGYRMPKGATQGAGPADTL